MNYFEDNADVEANGKFVVELGSSTSRFDVGIKLHQRRWQSRLANLVSE